MMLCKEDAFSKKDVDLQVVLGDLQVFLARYLQDMKRDLTDQISGIEQCLLNPNALPYRQKDPVNQKVSAEAAEEGGTSFDHALRQLKLAHFHELRAKPGTHAESERSQSRSSRHSSSATGFAQLRAKDEAQTKAEPSNVKVEVIQRDPSEPEDAAGDLLPPITSAESIRSVNSEKAARISTLRSFDASDCAIGSNPSVRSGPWIESPSKSIASQKHVSKENRIMRERRKMRLKRILEVNGELEHKASDRELARAQRSHSPLSRLRHLKGHNLEMFIDTCMSAVISANAVFIGFSLDAEAEGDFNGWEVVDICFTCTFLLELVTKCVMHGPCTHFCGHDKISNLFDSFLILIDSTQMLISLVFKDTAEAIDNANVPSASLFRIVRLMRLTRLIRLFRTEKFKDLMAMIQGLVGGALTLFWAVVVFFLMVYVVALVCREFFGNEPEPNVYSYFNNVPRSMFTVFRCSFGDCSTDGGVPIPEYISTAYGGGFGLLYCIFVFAMTIGLFNVISAIFVDATMAAQAEIAMARSTARLEDEERWASSVSTIIRELLTSTDNHTIDVNDMVGHIDKIVRVEFGRHDIDVAVREIPTLREALEALDIDTNDHKRLSDILDPDHSGTISILELVNGLQRLRGNPRRSDVVTVDLMVRSLQERVEEIHERVVSVHEANKLFQQSMSLSGMLDDSVMGSTGSLM